MAAAGPEPRDPPGVRCERAGRNGADPASCGAKPDSLSAVGAAGWDPRGLRWRGSAVERCTDAPALPIGLQDVLNNNLSGL